MVLEYDFDTLWIWDYDLDLVFGYDFEMILDMKSRWNRCGLDMILTWLWYGLGTKWLCGVPVGWHEKWKRGRFLKCFLILIRCVYDVYMILMFSKHIPKNNMNCKKQKSQFWATSKSRFWPYQKHAETISKSWLQKQSTKRKFLNHIQTIYI